jgi:hypothetical protein
MNWYLAKLIYSLDGYENPINAQFDEQLRLVNASDEETAYFKAKHLGKEMQSNFKTENGNDLRWSFIDVSELIKLNNLSDGVELYSNTIETHDKKSFIQTVLQKGLAIQSRHLVF